MARARSDHLADRWSDLDLVAFVDDPDVYTESGEWLGEFGPVILIVSEIHSNGNPEWIGVYAGGAKLDVLFAPAGDSREVAALIAGPMYREVYSRGVRVLLDRADPGMVGCTLAADPPLVSIPTQEELHHLLHELWINALRVAKFTRRGDVWRASQGIVPALRERLLTLAEWHARAIHGPEHDIWYEGRHLAEWADPRFLAALPDLFPSWDAASLDHCLTTILDCARWLGLEIAEAYGFVQPPDQPEIDRLLSGS